MTTTRAPSKSSSTRRTARSVDEHIGSRVRLRRALLGISQEKLGEAVGLSFQQVQKYERGVNRIGASRLFDLCRVLDVPVSFFFDDMPSEVAARSPDQIKGIAGKQAKYELDPMAKRETRELVWAYYKISDPKVRKRLFEITKTLAKMEQKAASEPSEMQEEVAQGNTELADFPKDIPRELESIIDNLIALSSQGVEISEATLADARRDRSEFGKLISRINKTQDRIDNLVADSC